MKKSAIIILLLVAILGLCRGFTTSSAFKSHNEEPTFTFHQHKTPSPRIHRRGAGPLYVNWFKQQSSSSSSSSSSKQKVSYEERRRIRQEISNLEDEDFLLADIKPKYLVHERDFFRVSTRMAAWDEYVLVSIVCTSISYNALSGFALNPDHAGIFFYEVLLKSIVQIVAGCAVLCGLYSTMVFSLSILYGKTALGLELDSQYDDFFDKTEDIRDKAFLAFSLALAFFALLVVLVLTEDLPLVMNFPIGAVMIVALFGGYNDWKVLVESGDEIYDFLDD